MQLDDIIKELNRIREQHGNIIVCTTDTDYGINEIDTLEIQESCDPIDCYYDKSLALKKILVLY